LKQLRVIISGGGTGGHIFPAVAIANALKLLHNNIEILFVGAEGRMEMEKVPQAGYKIVGLWISGLQRRLTIDNLSFPFKVISSLMKAKKIIREFKPDMAIGTGGYASGPLLRVATNKKIKTLIQEQNSYPGITNKLLSKKVDKICVAYDGMEKFFPKNKIILTGNPVRQEIQSIQSKNDEAYTFFGLDKNKKTILVIGGSLGARTVNESIAKAITTIEENNLQLIWQTGKGYISTAKEVVKGKENKGILAFDFISKMDHAYSVADIVISRAGAISISELCLVGKPCILIPSPNVAEDHQTKNAMALVKKDAAVLVKDSEAQEKLSGAIKELINNNVRQSELKQNISALAFKNAAETIAKEALALINMK
jgi:UDP-N-acetylglucosamine--N-acetylmuramyl-(pentapeptide) pyrophosphoryl-undecaprenol N-acetylglucosamine transferase